MRRLALSAVPSQPSTTAPAEVSEQVVCFRLQRRAYALRLSAISGVGDPEAMREVHGAPGMALGLSEWRGRLLTILDLPRLVGDRSTAGRPCLVRLAPPFDSVAFYLPVMVRLMRITLPPGEPCAGALRPLGRHDETSLYLIDPERLLAQADKAQEG